MPALCQDTIVYEIVSITDPDGFTTNVEAPYNEYTVEQVINFDGVIDGSGTDGTVDFTATVERYTSSQYPPGTWKVKVRGTALDGSVQEVDFDWILTDPCTPPNSVTVDPITLDDYWIVGEVYQKNYPNFTIDPPHC